MSQQTPEQQRARYELLKRRGQCIECLAPRGPDGTTVRCAACAGVHRQRQRERERARATPRQRRAATTDARSVAFIMLERLVQIEPPQLALCAHNWVPVGCCDIVAHRCSRCLRIMIHER